MRGNVQELIIIFRERIYKQEVIVIQIGMNQF